MSNQITLTDDQRAEVLGHLARLENLTEHDLRVILPAALEDKIEAVHAQVLEDATNPWGNAHIWRDAGAYTLGTLYRLDPERGRRVQDHHGNPHQWGVGSPSKCQCFRQAEDLKVVREYRVAKIREEREAREAREAPTVAAGPPRPDREARAEAAAAREAAGEVDPVQGRTMV